MPDLNGPSGKRVPREERDLCTKFQDYSSHTEGHDLSKLAFSIACYSSTMWPNSMALDDRVWPLALYNLAKFHPPGPYHLTGVSIFFSPNRRKENNNNGKQI